MSLDTFTRDISPPPVQRVKKADDAENKPSIAAIEAGKATIGDHLSYFVNRLSILSRSSNDCPRLALQDFQSLYKRNQHLHGNHFTVHQHDHPIAGVHYDMRIQFSDTSTISFAIPYGLPGNPNSSRPNRMMIETRVHNLWNNLIESASHATGSLLIWDTGEYEVLPRPEKRQQATDDEISEEETYVPSRSQSEKLIEAFQARHIRLRLHGTRLPRNYTVALRLPSHNDRASQPKKPERKRRRIVKPSTTIASDSDSESARMVATPVDDNENENIEAAMASEDEGEVTRITNAYRGSFNTIGSIHQRHWFITLDRGLSGFRKEAGDSRWTGDWDHFYVLGREHERSVITGRSADEVMADDGVEEFVGRKMWRPITE